MNFFKRFWPGRGGATMGPVAVDTPCFVLGDIHGCATLADRLLAKAPDDAQVICVGDYVDRGDRSADVLRMLMARPDITCLMGNHEAMLLRFLDDPTGKGQRWLRYGGLQTLASFGVTGGTETKDPVVQKRLSDALRAAMGDAMIDWLRNLRHSLRRGNVLITHAGADPAAAADDQDDNTLMWGHPDFGRKRRADGLWVLHGHTIVNVPEIRNGAIAIDTGAYATGRLTAAHLTGDGCTFVGVDHTDV